MKKCLVKFALQITCQWIGIERYTLSALFAFFTLRIFGFFTHKPFLIISPLFFIISNKFFFKRKVYIWRRDDGVVSYGYHTCDRWSWASRKVAPPPGMPGERRGRGGASREEAEGQLQLQSQGAHTSGHGSRSWPLAILSTPGLAIF